MPLFQTREEYDRIKGEKKIFGKEDCPFCDIEAQKGHTVWKGKYWYILHNIFPYSGNNQHIMAIPYSHVPYSVDLGSDEIGELKDIYAFVKDFYGEDDYFSCTRETMANRSIEHFHIHFIPGKLKEKYLIKMLQDQGFPVEQKLEA